MSTGREASRDALVTLLAAALIGVGKPVKTVTGSKVESLQGLTPLVGVLPTGTLRERMTFQGDRPTFGFELQTWVIQSATSWTFANSIDALDNIEARIAAVFEAARGTATWEVIEYAGASSVLEIEVAGIPYYLERIPSIVKLARS